MTKNEAELELKEARSRLKSLEQELKELNVQIGNASTENEYEMTLLSRMDLLSSISLCQMRISHLQYFIEGMEYMSQPNEATTGGCLTVFCISAFILIWWLQCIYYCL